MLSPLQIARALGGDVVGRDQVIVPGPGHSPKDRSLSIRIDSAVPDSFLCFSHAGDDPMACKAYVMERLGIETSRRRDNPPTTSRRREVSEERYHTAIDAERTALALRIWSEARDPVGTLVERYLSSRGLQLPETEIRFHRACHFKGQPLPCLIALFRNIETGEPQAITRIALTADARKIDRAMLGPVAGAAIMLDAFEDVTYGLTIGEGLETTLAARQLGFKPAWALGSSGAIGSFPTLAGIDCLTILAEQDEASTKAAKTCGERWHEAGREVHIVRPRPGLGSDVNDAIRGAGQ